jgi:flagellar motor switch protein FliG
MQNNEPPKKDSNHIFLDGKNQVIQILRALSAEEKNKLLNNMKKRNPALVNELILQSYSFLNLLDLTDQELSILFRYIDGDIIGIAISDIEASAQRRILHCMERARAEKAFENMNVKHKPDYILKAQSKILDVASLLVEKQQISFRYEENRPLR